MAPSVSHGACRRRLAVLGALLAVLVSAPPTHGQDGFRSVTAASLGQRPGLTAIAIDEFAGRAFIGFLYDTTGRPVLVLDTVTGRFLLAIPLPADT